MMEAHDGSCLQVWLLQLSLAHPNHLCLLPICHPQIVIVGASDTGLACAEALLTSPRHRHTAFINLTLLSPGGLASAAAAASTCHPPGLEGFVTLVDGMLAGVDRNERVAVLRDGSVLRFDLLVLTTGLQVETGLVLMLPCTAAGCLMILLICLKPSAHPPQITYDTH